MRVLVFLDGTVADPEVPQISANDLGLLRGDGVFETVLVVDGKPREIGPHLDRLARSAAMLDLPEPDRAGWERVVDLVLANWRGGPEMVLKLVYTRGIEGTGVPTGFALGLPIDASILRARAAGVSVITLDRGIDSGVFRRLGGGESPPWMLLGAKSLSYGVNMAAVREAARRGADDAIYVTADGQVLEGPTSTVVAVRDRTLYTPPAGLGILPGTTQAALFRGAERAGWSVKAESLWVRPPAEPSGSDAILLRDCDGVFLTSSVRKITRVLAVDGAPVQDSAALHAELVAAYEAEYR